MRRILLILIGFVVVFVLAYEFIPFQVTYWDGGFTLTVNIESSVGKPRTVYCEAYGRQEYAKDILDNLKYMIDGDPLDSQPWSTVADPFDGRTLSVPVPVSGKISWLGRELERSQHKYLVVMAMFPNGRRVGKLVEIPDGRVSRTVKVILP